jgi:hypothetical protein
VGTREVWSAFSATFVSGTTAFAGLAGSFTFSSLLFSKISAFVGLGEELGVGRLVVGGVVGEEVEFTENASFAAGAWFSKAGGGGVLAV